MKVSISAAGIASTSDSTLAEVVMLNVQKISSIYKNTSDLRGQKDNHLDLYDSRFSRRTDAAKLAKEFKEILDKELKKNKSDH